MTFLFTRQSEAVATAKEQLGHNAVYQAGRKEIFSKNFIYTYENTRKLQYQ